MKNLRKVLCLVVAALMLLQVAAFAMSTNGVDYVVSQPDENGNMTVSASTFIGGVDDTGAKFATAVYDADGNVVSSAEAESEGGNRLKNEVTMKEGQTVKSFVWDENNNPVEKTATKDNGINPEDVEITFNNIDFETYVGEALSFDADDHEKEYVVTFLDKELALPKVKVKTKENSIKYVLDEQEGKTIITFYAGNKIITEDPTNAGTVTNKSGVEKNKFAYLVNGKERLDEGYTYEFTEKVIITYDYTSGGKVWTDGDIATAGDIRTWYNTVVPYMASKQYTVAEGQTKSITLTVSSPECASLLIVKGKDNTKDVLVNSDGSALTWATSEPVTSSSGIQGISAYNYRLNPNGTRDFSQGLEKARATGVDYSTTKITGSSSTTLWIGRNTQNSDGDYVTGTVLTSERSPISGNRMEYTAIPEEYLGHNYISFPKKTVTGCTFTITVNDNIDSIVMFAIDKSSSYGIKDSEDTANWAFTKGDYGRRRYQNTVNAATFAYLEVLGYNSNNELKEGRYVRQNLMDELVAKYGANNFKINDSSLYQYKSQMNTSQSAVYKATYHEDYVEVGNTVPTPLITDPELCYDEYVAYCTEKGLTPVTLAALTKDNTNSPRIIKFGSHMPSVYADRSGFNQRSGTGALLHSPDGFNFDNAVYIGTNLNWQNAESTFRTYFKDGMDRPLFSFTANRDCRVVVVYPFKANVNSWIGKADGGWDHFALDSENSFHVMELSILAGSDSAIRDLGSCFVFCQFYTKDFLKGEEIVIKNTGSSNAPMVFVFENDEIPHTPDLADIKVAGESIADFDAATTTYSYVLSEEQIASTTAPVVTATPADPTSDVEIVYNKTFPGGATINVTDAHGFEKTYTVNFVCDIDMVYDIVMCDNNSYTYTALRDEYYASTKEPISSGEVTYTVAFTKGTMGANNNTVAAYVKGGTVVGALGYTDRDKYLIESIADESYIGKDRIVGSIGWYNGADTMKAAFHGAKVSRTSGDKTVDITPLGETYIPNWLNFKTKRAATVKVCTVADTNGFANLTRAGFEKEANTASRFVIDINGSDRKHYYAATKNVAADTTVSVPNAHVGDSAYCVVLFYADWE